MGAYAGLRKISRKSDVPLCLLEIFNGLNASSSK
ncbi:uncharacterized protein J3R85_014192 [Psidium guajava]|nr:uncharacterized protein J3R85_014192 [Psidium guajava]